MNEPIIKSSPRDVFMYLLATITLYFSAWSVMDLLFSYINAGFPDALNPYYDLGGAIRWSLALLVIIFPVYLWVSRFLHRELITDPAKSDIKIRKWLLYFTLFIAALLIIGDLVALIYNFLGGELTARFLLKIASVLAVAVAVFWYYLYDLRAGGAPLASRAKWFVRVVIVAAVAVAVAGFILAGSPFRQRLIKFDQQKLSDLQAIQSQTVNYWQQKGELPAALNDLRDTISGFAPPTDPQTGASYTYQKTGTLSFKICADFNLDSQAANGTSRTVPLSVSPYGTMENWEHGAGNQCFTRTIDPQLYRKNAPIPPNP